MALADPSAEGRKETASRLNLATTFGDYRQMLQVVRPDIVCIGPSWLNQRVEMISAAAEVGAHIFCEKPFVSTLAKADRIAAACRRAGIKLAMAHQWAAAPPVRKIIHEIRAGKYGKLLRAYIRPKGRRTWRRPRADSPRYPPLHAALHDCRLASLGVRQCSGKWPRHHPDGPSDRARIPGAHRGGFGVSCHRLRQRHARVLRQHGGPIRGKDQTVHTSVRRNARVREEADPTPLRQAMPTFTTHLPSWQTIRICNGRS